MQSNPTAAATAARQYKKDGLYRRSNRRRSAALCGAVYLLRVNKFYDAFSIPEADGESAAGNHQRQADDMDGNPYVGRCRKAGQRLDFKQGGTRLQRRV